jgi:transcriptional regulator with XRE-family HTH domain
VAKPRTATEAVAQHVREWRIQNGWSVRRLAEECEKAGLSTLTQSSLTNLERGLTSKDPARRGGRPVTLEEVIGLAYVLGTTPEQLMIPYEDEEMQVVPGVSAHPFVVAMWMQSQDLASPQIWESPFHTDEGLTAQSPQWVYRNFDIAYRRLSQVHGKLGEAGLTAGEREQLKTHLQAALVSMAIILEVAAKHDFHLPPVPRWMRDELLNAQNSGELSEPTSVDVLRGPIGSRRVVTLPPIRVQEDQ